MPAVASFLRRVISKSGEFQSKVISLSMSSRDPADVRLRSPKTWVRGVQVVPAVWDGVPINHVGAHFGEFEFQRFQPRIALSKLLLDCDLVQVVCGSPAWANSVIGIGKPVSLQCATRARIERRRQEALAHGVVERWRKTMTAITDRLEVRALRSARAIQVENQWMFDYVKGVVDGLSVNVMYAPPGIDSAAFSPLSRRDRDGSQFILCVGRLDDPRKNVELLLDAFARCIPYVDPSIKLVLAGQAGPAASFWGRVEALGLSSRVRFIERPPQAGLVDLLRRATVFVLPSDEEGLGVVLLEAMSCGAACVSTRCGGPDSVITDGKDGFLVPLNDAHSLAARIRQIATDADLAARLGVAARATIERRFAEDVAGRPFVECWERLLAGKQ